MKTPYLCESCSVLIAVVLLVADYRHITMRSPEGPAASADQAGVDLRHILDVKLQIRNAGGGAAMLSESDVGRQLSGLSALMAAGAARRPDPAVLAASYPGSR